MSPAEQAYDSSGKIIGLETPAATLAWGHSGEDDGAANARTPRLARALRQEWTVALLYLALDVTAWVTLYATMTVLRHDAYYATRMEFAFIDLIQLVVIVQALYIIGGYDRNVDKRSLAYTAEHILAIAAAAIFSAMIIYSVAAYDGTMKPSRGVLLLSFLAFLPLSLFYRRWIRKYVAAAIANRAFLVIGGGTAAARFYKSYEKSPTKQRLHFVAAVENEAGRPVAGEGSPIVDGDLEGRLRNLGDHYSGIILAEELATLSSQLLSRLVRTQFQRTRVYTLESFYETHWRYVPLDAIDPVWPLQTGFQLARISPYHYLKRLFDIVASALALLMGAPFILLLAIVIKIDSRGPAFFKQTRVGREDNLFTIYKFRSMFFHDETEPGDIYTRPGDARVTRVGRWMRKLRLDELPQLWNVFNGELSLIGPRAEWLRCVERYEKAIPFYHFRHLVKPGITGWAQVNYPYGESDEDAIEKLQYDLYYIRHYSLKLDAMIVLKTIYVMLFSKGR